MFLQLLQRNADYFPDDIAIVYGDERITHSELLRRVEAVAGGFAAMGIRPGDRIALLLENSPEFIVTFYAAAACRAVNVPLNIEYKEDEVRYYLEDAAAKCIVTDAQRFARASAAASAVTQSVEIISTAATDGNATQFADLLESDTPAPAGNGSLDDDLIYIYSSGSTGRPKCAPRTVVQYWWEMDDAIQCLGLGRDDRIFCVIPLYHNFAAVQCMLTSAGSGARLVILKSPNPFGLRRQAALSLMEKERVTIFPVVPFILQHLIDSTKTADLSRIRVCYSAAAALSEETAEAFYAKFGVHVRDHYGCTEVGAMTIDLDPVPRAHGRTVGKPFPGVRVRILDDAGNALPANTKGEVVVSSRAMTRGYLGLDELNRQAFRDGCFHTGDLGRLDEQGRLFLLGRKKFIIDVSGHKVDPYEVEDAIAEHEHVEAAIVVSAIDTTLGSEVVKAYVVATGPCDESTLIAFCRDRLANFKVPRSVEFIREIPKNPMGKEIRKAETLDRYIVQAAQSRSAGGV